MASTATRPTKRIRIASSHWRALKVRAAQRRSTPAQYADFIFSYPIAGDVLSIEPRSMDDPDEEIYVELELDDRTRGRLTAGSETHRLSLASYAGKLLGSFL